MSDLIKLGGLWTNKDKNGKTYLTGKLSPSVRILIFKNEFREAENQPTHILYLSAVEPRPGEEAGPDTEDSFFEDALPAEPAPRPSAAAPRTTAPAPRPSAPAPRTAAPAPPARPQTRRPTPAPVEDDLDDPFAD